MKPAIVIVGMGQLGGEFAKGFLRCGHPVAPVLRGMSMRDQKRAFPDPGFVLITVGEDDLHPVLDAIPDAWRDRLGLLQNELLPQDWEAHQLPHPTVCVVRFEKKKGRPARAEVPSYVYGPHAELIVRALRVLEIPVEEMDTAREIMLELVRKNLFILTTNITGLVVGGTLEDLWEDHRDLTMEVAKEVLDLQEAIVGVQLPRESMIEHMIEVFRKVPDQSAMGRSAPDRLARTLRRARDKELDLPRMEQIEEEL